MGIGLLYGLAVEGWTDTILVEKGELTSGSTWHAAGQCPSFIANYNLAKVHAFSNDLYAKLESKTGEATGWHATGGIRFATNQLELDHFKRVEGVAANIGFRMQVISPEEIRRINPFVTTEGVLAGAWTLDDGYVDPSATTASSVSTGSPPASSASPRSRATSPASTSSTPPAATRTRSARGWASRRASPTSSTSTWSRAP
jgi:dimethylglycine dehydrogenase